METYLSKKKWQKKKSARRQVLFLKKIKKIALALTKNLQGLFREIKKSWLFVRQNMAIKFKKEKTGLRKKTKKIRGKDWSLILPLYFGWEIELSLHQIDDLKKHIVGPFKSYWQYISAVVVVIMIASFAIFISNNRVLRAATYSWVQNSWVGGISETIATHASNQSGWTYYSAKDDGVSADTAITLTETSSSLSKTSDTDFSGGTFSFTAVSGSGNDASIIISAGYTNATSTVAGLNFSCAVISDGTVKCWGYNYYGQLGDGTTINSQTPVTVSGITNAKAVAVGQAHACALLSDSTIKCWGNNGSGQLGDGSTTQRTTPVSVSGISTATAITAGGYFSCALLSDNTIKCWGSNGSGQLGDGSTTNRNTPVAVSEISTATTISAGGNHTCAVLSDSTIKCWGYNGTGQLGDDTVDRKTTPVTVSGITTATTVTAGERHTCAILSDNTAQCWGDNSNGELGDDSTTQRLTPVSVSGISTAIAISASKSSSGYHTCALLSDNTVKCWGYNSSGQLGDGSFTQRKTPVSVSGLTGATAITTGNAFSCALLSNDTIKCWGTEGSSNEGGLGDTFSFFKSQAEDAVSGIHNAIDIQSSADFSCALLSDNTIKCWGSNGSGQLGDGSTTQRTTPVSVSGISTATTISVGQAHACALLSDSTIKCWGNNGSGQLGDGSTTQRTTPVSVSGISTATAITAGGYFSCALLSDNTIKCWGSNGSGQLGDDTVDRKTTPVTVSGISTATTIDAGASHTCAVLSDSTVKCWGSNSSGQLGDGSTTQRTTPVSVSGISTATAISAGGSYTCAMLSDSTVKCWGYNGYGQLGDGSTTQRTTPVSVSGLTNAMSITTGDNHSCVSTSSNTVKCWGNNTHGQLGNNSTTSSNTPVTATVISLASKVTAGSNHVCVLETNGTINCFGKNTNGQLGIESYGFSNSTSPIYVANIGSYLSSGTFTSPIVDQNNSSFGTMTYASSSAANTIIKIKIRSSSNADMSGATDWYACAPIASGDNVTNSGCVTNGQRYLQYQVVFFSSDPTITPEFQSITINYNSYPASATLTSSVFDSADATNAMESIAWSESLMAGSDVKFQIRTSPDNSTWTDYLGPTGTGDFYTDPGGGETINSAHTSGGNDRYFQYQITLVSSGSNIPTVSSVTVNYVVNAAPEFFNAPTASQNSDGTIAISYAVRDPDTDSGNPANRGYVTPSFFYSTDNGSNWYNVTKGMGSATSTLAIDDLHYTTSTVVWNPSEQNVNAYSTTFKIKVTVNDGEGANATASSESAAFTVDLKAPSLGTQPILVDATTDPATITLDASDDSALQICVTLDNSQTNCSDYNTSATLDLSTDPDTVYVIFKDAFGNISSANATTPQTPTHVMIKDIANVDAGEYKLFVSWASVSTPLDEFDNYHLYYSVDGENYSELGTISDRATNYYIHSSLTSGTTYYYKLFTNDKDGNKSYYSSIVSDDVDGQGGTDSTAPTISNVSMTSTTTQSIIIKWDTDELSNSTIAYSTSAGVFGPDTSGSTTMADNESGLGQHSVVLNNLTPDTTYYFSITSEDPSGNSSTETSGGDGFSFTTLPGPAISAVSASSVSNNSATITWNTDINANSAVVYSTSATLSNPIEITDDTEVTQHSITITGLTSGTKYYYYVKSADARENNGTNYYNFITTADIQAPIITGVVANIVTDDQAQIIWTTSEPATSKAFFGTVTGNYTTSTGDNESLDTSHSADISDLTNNTKYYYIVVSADASGNRATSSESDFTTLQQLSEEDDVVIREEAARVPTKCGGGGGGATLDTTPPNISEFKTENIGGASATVSWKTNEMADHLVEFGPTIEYGTFIGKRNQRSTQHLVTLTGLNPDTIYHYRATSADASGNLATSPDATFTTSGTISETDKKNETNANQEQKTETTEQTTEDENIFVTTIKKTVDFITEMAGKVSLNILESGLSSQINMIKQLSNTVPPPVMSGEPKVLLSADSATIFWTTDKESSSLISFAADSDYQKEKKYSQTVGNSEEKTTNHSVTIANLKPETIYHYQLISKTEVGATATSPDFTFQTPQKTTEVENHSFEVVSPDTVKFKWVTTIPTDSRVKIVPYVDGVAVPDRTEQKTDKNFTTIHEINFDGFESGVTYNVELSGKDASGKTITRSIPAFSTSDTDTPPIIKQIQTDSALSAGSETMVQSIISWVTNEPSTSRIHYEKGIGRADEELKNKTPLDNNYTRKHLVVITNFEPGVVYRFQVESMDTAGNSAKSKIYTILTPRQKESVFQVIIKNIEQTFSWMNLLK